MHAASSPTRRPRGRLTALLPVLLAVSAAGVAPAPQASEEPAEPPPAPPVTLEKITLEPARPGPDTLCRLTVTLANRGPHPVSRLAFEVTVAGHELPVYRNRVFLVAVAPGATEDLRLYNFWSSETGRPWPADGRLPVEVELVAAEWQAHEVRREEGGEVEVWSSLGTVPGLPVRAAVEAGAPPAAAD